MVLLCMRIILKMMFNNSLINMMFTFTLISTSPRSTWKATTASNNLREILQYGCPVTTTTVLCCVSEKKFNLIIIVIHTPRQKCFMNIQVKSNLLNYWWSRSITCIELLTLVFTTFLFLLNSSIQIR